MVKANATVLSKTNINNAIERGLTYLHQTQRASGEFATYTSSQLDMRKSVAYPKSVYVTTFVIHSLCYLPNNDLIKTIQQKAANFLIAEQEEFGAWNYEGRSDSRLAPDLDDTSCAVAALLKLNHQPDFSFYMLLWQNGVNSDGPYYTWIGINERVNERLAKKIDALVNANILFCAGLLRLSIQNTVDYLKEVVQRKSYDSQDVYWLSPYFFIYALSRAYADGEVIALAPIIPTLQNHIFEKISHCVEEKSLFNLACLTVSLLNIKADISIITPYLKILLDSQEVYGSWPAWGAYAGYNPLYDGSPALTTAFVLEAFGKSLIYL